uniref:Uncharacterized protein n=1 Tax=Tetraselmis sp. GSL018 TaxID=582737 RepID=A0A061QLQ6_9CHLO
MNPQKPKQCHWCRVRSLQLGLYQRVQPQQPLHASVSMESRAVFQRMEHLCGLSMAQYGGHGLEVIQVFMTQDMAPEETAGIGGLRLVGLKLTGDPNVPATKLSFVAALTEPDDPEGVLADLRPIIAFPSTGPAVVNLQDREVAGLFLGKGQINRDPDVWAPEWVDVRLITYSGQRKGFSILWHDMGEFWRHIIDFAPLESPDAWAGAAWAVAEAKAARSAGRVG